MVRGIMAVAALLVDGLAPTATSPRTVALTVSVAGSGTVKVTRGNHFASFTCKRSSCRQVFRVPVGSRVEVSTTPATGWKLATRAGPCGGTASTCSLRVRRPVQIGITFAAPETQASPVPLGTTATIDGFWYLNVSSSQLQGNSLVVQITATATHMSLILSQLDFNLFLRGSHSGEYSLASGRCAPPAPDVLSLGTFDPTSGHLVAPEGQPLTGNVCFDVPPEDAPFVLFTEPPARAGLNPTGVPPNPPDTNGVWFALR
jgi:hypothetical protein